MFLIYPKLKTPLPIAPLHPIMKLLFDTIVNLHSLLLDWCIIWERVLYRL